MNAKDIAVNVLLVLRGWVAALWRSIVSMIKSPQVWAASAAVFVIGFSVGHMERARVIADLKSEISRTSAEAKVATAANGRLRAALEGATSVEKDLRAQIAALESRGFEPSQKSAKAKKAGGLK